MSGGTQRQETGGFDGGFRRRGEREVAVLQPAGSGRAVPGGAFVLLERCGGLWAVPSDAVERLMPDGVVEVRDGGGRLRADRVIAIATGLLVHPASPSLVRWWHQPHAGLAAYEGRPVVVIDAGRPPAPLLDEAQALVADEAQENGGGR